MEKYSLRLKNMEERDFYWCLDHENLFQGWLYYISLHNSLKYPHLRLDNATIFSLWQEAKEYALQIANSKKPVLLFDSTMSGIIINNPDNKVFIIMFICSMLSISDNKILNLLGTSRNRVYINLDSWHDRHLADVYEVIFDRILDGSIKRDYDYSLPDGGIKDETETDETPQLEETAENNETLLEKLMPIFYGNKEQAEDYIKNIKKTTNDVEKVQYTAQLVNENTISERSCHRVLYRILHDHGLYNKTETNWNKVISQYLVKK